MEKLRFIAGALVSIALGSSSVGCVADAGQEDPVSDTGQSEDKLLAGRLLSESEVAGLLRDAGLDEADIPAMVCTAKYESSFYERASNRNKNGTYDRGLFQINSVHIGDRGCPRTSSGLYDAKANTACALTVYRSQGIRAWYGYRKHQAECDSYELSDR